MPLSLAAKEAIVAEMHEQALAASAMVVADYRGMSVTELTTLRKHARDAGVKLSVIRNSLAKRAFEGTDFACLEEVLNGPNMLGLSMDEPSASARLMRDHVREYPELEIKALAVNGELYAATDLAKVAALPTKDEALSQLLSVIKAPVTKLAQTLQAVPSKLVRTLVALKDQKSADES